MSASRSIRVVLVDDHKMMRDGLRMILEGQPEIDVVGEAADGRSALQLVAKLEPAVVIMDVAMEGMNGIEATRAVIESRPATKVVVLSTHSDKRYVLNALQAGASAYVLKDAASDDLLRAVRTVHQGLTYLSSEIAGVVVARCLSEEGPDKSSAYGVLGKREREVLQLIAEGRTSKEVGAQLGITVHTVETHRRNISKKVELHSVAELTKYAVREGLTSLEP